MPSWCSLLPKASSRQQWPTGRPKYLDGSVVLFWTLTFISWSLRHIKSALYFLVQPKMESRTWEIWTRTLFLPRTLLEGYQLLCPLFSKYVLERSWQSRHVPGIEPSNVFLNILHLVLFCWVVQCYYFGTRDTELRFGSESYIRHLWSNNHTGFHWYSTMR